MEVLPVCLVRVCSPLSRGKDAISLLLTGVRMMENLSILIKPAEDWKD